MNGALVEESTTRAEDTALLGSNRSADPGAKTEGRAAGAVCRIAAHRPVARLAPLRDWHQGDKSLAAQPRALNVKTPGDGLPVVANSERPALHFTLNQYRWKRPIA